MPANTQHAKIAEFAPLWEKCRDVVKGEEAVKARNGGITYLPMLDGMDQQLTLHGNKYGAYKMRASFYSASGRTVDGLIGAIQRKPPKKEMPKDLEDRLPSIGRAAESLDQMVTTTLRETLTTSRMGLLVDAPPTAEGVDYPSYVSIYCAEDIINWRQQIIKGKKILTMVVLQEEHQTIDPKDPYKLITEPQWRCLHLGIAGAYAPDGKALDKGFVQSDTEKPFYYQEVWRKDPNSTKQDQLVMVEKIVPRKSGGRLFLEIPFAFVNASDGEPDPKEPMLLDLVNVNLSHYRTSADLEHGRHFTALPTPWFAGFDFKSEVVIGSGVAYVSNEPNATAGMLEFTGAGLGSLSMALKEKEQQMAILGSRLLDEMKAGVESAAAMQLRTAGEQSALTLVSKTVSEAWTKVLRWLWSWTQTTDDGADKIKYTLNTDFGVFGLDGRQLTALTAVVQGGLMSWDTWFFNLQRAGLVAEHVTAEDERADIEENGIPAAMGMVLTGPGAMPPEPNPADAVPPQDKGTQGAASGA